MRIGLSDSSVALVEVSDLAEAVPFFGFFDSLSILSWCSLVAFRLRVVLCLGVFVSLIVSDAFRLVDFLGGILIIEIL
jgi:hypothetical protein